MELKERINGGTNGMAEFQSHLYGIERRAAFPPFYDSKSFNRTFMELKD